MKYLLSLSVLSILLTGCRQITEQADKPVVTKGKYFFDFDEVVYYKIDIVEESIYTIIKEQNKTDYKQLLLSVLTYHNMPESIKDTLFISKLEKIGFVKKELPKSSNPALNEIFHEKECADNSVAACMPFFRDVYIFKKKGKTIGVAKICYGCGTSSFIGTEASTDCFGKNNELKQLEKIVK